MNVYDIIEEMRESFNYYSLDDVNALYDFIKSNETNVKKLVYDKTANVLMFQ